MARRSKMAKVSHDAENEKTNIALYIRVSTDAQVDGYSIDVQKERLEAYVKSMFSEPDTVTMYIDGGFTGANLDRPRMKDMIADIQNGLITHVIVMKLDRLSRSQRDTLYLIEDVFTPNNVSFISINESFNTSTSFGRTAISILSAFAQMERETIYERTRSGMRKRVEDGYWPGGGMTPFGYDYDQNIGYLVPNKDADTVKHMYELFLSGYSEGMIAKKFNIKYDRLVHQILTRKSNTGVIVYNGEEYPGRHAPIISLDIYNKTMKIMKERSSKKFVAKTKHLLTGLFECGICGAKMRYQTWTNGTHKIMCYSQQTSKAYLRKSTCCDNLKIDSQLIENAVLNDIFSMTDEISEIDHEAGEKEKKGVLDVLTEQKTIAENKLKRLYNLFAGSSDDCLLDTINEIRAEIDTLNKSINEEVEKNNRFAEAISTQQQFRGLRDVWDIMTNEERISAIRALIEKIVINKEKIDRVYKV